MRSLKTGSGESQQTYICAHWRVFPPAGAGGDAEALRAVGDLDTAQYTRLQLWEKICGLMAMSPDKCVICPHRREVVWKTRGPYLRSPDGTENPVVDMAQGEATPRNRHMAGIFRKPGTAGTHQSAAWVESEESG